MYPEFRGESKLFIVLLVVAGGAISVVLFFSCPRHTPSEPEECKISEEVAKRLEECTEIEEELELYKQRDYCRNDFAACMESLEQCHNALTECFERCPIHEYKSEVAEKALASSPKRKQEPLAELQTEVQQCDEELEECANNLEACNEHLSDCYDYCPQL